MPRYIKYIETEGVLGRFDIYQEFQEGVNVLFGRNGTGKTTLLHILANLLNGDYRRFAFIEFSKIKVQFDDETNIVVSKYENETNNYINVLINGDIVAKNISVKEIREQEIREQELSREERVSNLYRQEIMQKRNKKSVNSVLPVAYFPAFRTMIEAWESSRLYALMNTSKTQYFSTNFARELFGSFVPSLNYPSSIEIERILSEEIEEALLKIAYADRENFRELVPSIFQVLSKSSPPAEKSFSLEEKSEAILEEINYLVKKLEDYPLKAAPKITELRNSVESFQIDEIYKSIAEKVLKIYREALKKVITVQEDSFRGIDKYLNSVNSFLEEKKIEISFAENKLRPSVSIKFDKGTPKTIPGICRALSSGEREIVTLIYAATHMSKQQIVLIDEPEISLHVNWQRHLLKEMSEQLGDRQIIVCTHSPVIGADYEERVIIFDPKITCSSAINNELVDEDNEVL